MEALRAMKISLQERRDDGKGEKKRRSRRSWALLLAAGLPVALAQRIRAESHLDYRYFDYGEEGDRIRVQTHSAYFEWEALSSLSLSGEFVYDAISGASPTGAPPPAGSRQVPLAYLEDVRTAGNLSAGIHWGGNQTTTPQFAYSLENDYESVGLSLNHAIDLNQKNTTLTLGLAYTYDQIFPSFWNGDRDYKNSGEALIGLTQLLGPKTIFNLTFTYGLSRGYLADPYKSFRFSDYPLPDVTFPEKRPDRREKEVGYLSLTQFVTPLNGSAELTYRIYHDFYGILSHTAGLSWFQKVGAHVIISPMFRFMSQTAADFYAVQLPGDPTVPPDDPFGPMVPIPASYSADYRLSALQTFTYGLDASVKIKDRLSLDFGYKRYEMVGQDHRTSSSAYPKANIFSAGFSFWF
jgi:Protein of unknown function (DUF3570)